MSEFIPREKDLTINPITGRPMIGRDLEQHYPSLQSSSGLRQSYSGLLNSRGNQSSQMESAFPSPKLKQYMKIRTERNVSADGEGKRNISKSFMADSTTSFRKEFGSNGNQ